MRIVGDDGVTIIAARPQRPPSRFGGEKNVLYLQQLAAAEWDESAESQKKKLNLLRNVATLLFETQDEVVKCVPRMTKQILEEKKKKIQEEQQQKEKEKEKEREKEEKLSILNKSRDLNVSYVSTGTTDTNNNKDDNYSTNNNGGRKGVSFDEKNIIQQQILQQQPDEASAINLSAAVASIVIHPDTSTYRTLKQLPQSSPQRKQQQETDSALLAPMRQFQDQFIRQEMLDRTRKLWREIEHVSSSEQRMRSDLDKARKLDAMLHSPPRIAVRTQNLHSVRKSPISPPTDENEYNYDYDQRLTELVIEEMIKIREKQERERLRKLQQKSSTKTTIIKKKVKKTVLVKNKSKNKHSDDENSSGRSSLRPVEIGDDFAGQLVEFEEDEEVEVQVEDQQNNNNNQDEIDEEELRKIENDDEAEEAIRRITMQLKKEQQQRQQEQKRQKQLQKADEEATKLPNSSFTENNNVNETKTPSQRKEQKREEEENEDDQYVDEYDRDHQQEGEEPEIQRPNEKLKQKNMIQARNLSVQLSPQERQEKQMQEKFKLFKNFAPNLMARYGNDLPMTPPPKQISKTSFAFASNTPVPKQVVASSSSPGNQKRNDDSFDSLPPHLRLLLGGGNNSSTPSPAKQQKQTKRNSLSMRSSHFSGSLVKRARDLVQHAAIAAFEEQQQQKSQ